jgi:hypothetical protein
MDAEERGSRLRSLLSEVLMPETESSEKDEVSADPIGELLDSTEKVRNLAYKAEAFSKAGPEQELYLIEVLEDIHSLKEKLDDVIIENPLFRTNLIILEKLVGEYDKLDQQISVFIHTIISLVGIKLTGERSRVRDNLTQLVTERWRLLNSILDNVNKLHSNVVKARTKGKMSEEEDLFSGYAKYAEEKNYES